MVPQTKIFSTNHAGLSHAKNPSRFFDSAGQDIASWTVTFYLWTPFHWNVRALSRAGNSQSLPHQLPCVLTTAFETPTGNEQVRYPVWFFPQY